MKLGRMARRTAVTRSLMAVAGQLWEHARKRTEGGVLCILRVAA
jgi:hypothetical protein